VTRLIGLARPLGGDMGSVALPDLGEETDQPESDQQELVKQQVRGIRPSGAHLPELPPSPTGGHIAPGVCTHAARQRPAFFANPYTDKCHTRKLSTILPIALLDGEFSHCGHVRGQEVRGKRGILAHDRFAPLPKISIGNPISRSQFFHAKQTDKVLQQLRP
jgi:hypothetical protein